MRSPRRLALLATLPQTRRLLMAAGRSASLRELGRRARTDPAGLARSLRDPATAAGLAREAMRHPATRELADLGLLVLGGRYLAAARMAAWLWRRLLPGAAKSVRTH